MGSKRALNSRAVAVGSGAAVLALLAGGAGYAAGQIDSRDIENNSILSKDVHDGKLRLKDLSDGTKEKLQGQDGKDAFEDLQARPRPSPTSAARSTTGTPTSGWDSPSSRARTW